MTRNKPVAENYDGITVIEREFDYLTETEATQYFLCTIPASSERPTKIVKPLSGVDVHVAFNDAGTSTLDIGTSGTADLYATDLALGTVAFVPLDEAVSMKLTSPTTLYFRPVQTNAGSTGSGTIRIAYTRMSGDAYPS